MRAALTILSICARRRSIYWCPWATVGKSWFQHKRLPNVSRECFPEGINLVLHIGHWPGAGAFLQNSHVAGEVFPGICVQIRVWRGDCNLS